MFELVEMGSNETIKQAVIAGMGIAFLSAHTISLELQLGHLVVAHASDVEQLVIIALFGDVEQAQ